MSNPEAERIIGAAEDHVRETFQNILDSCGTDAEYQQAVEAQTTHELYREDMKSLRYLGSLGVGTMVLGGTLTEVTPTVGEGFIVVGFLVAAASGIGALVARHRFHRNWKT